MHGLLCSKIRQTAQFTTKSTIRALVGANLSIQKLIHPPLLKFFAPQFSCLIQEHNITLKPSLQVLQNKAAKVILNRQLCSSSTELLASLKWLPLEKRRLQRRCVHVYKWINGLINHDVDLIRQDVLHRHNTRNKGNFRLPGVKRNWGMQRIQYHAVSDFNSFSQTIKDSRNVNSFKRNVFKFLI